VALDQARGGLLHACESVSQAKAGIGRSIEFYNTRRPHSTLDKKTPDGFCLASLLDRSAATVT
jgi:transposase InsO family protein